MALTIATGFVVDDAIVMIEIASRYIEAGETPMQAALKGGQAVIGFTIISLTFSLIAVLIPLLFMGDVVGRLFREFAITLAVSILISAVVSLTLNADDVRASAQACAGRKQGRFYHASGRAFDCGHCALRPHARMGARPSGALDAAKWPAGTLLILTRSACTYVGAEGGFFPVAGYRCHNKAISRRHASRPHSAAMGERQQVLADTHPARPGGRKPDILHRHRRRECGAQ